MSEGVMQKAGAVILLLLTIFLIGASDFDQDLTGHAMTVKTCATSVDSQCAACIEHICFDEDMLRRFKGYDQERQREVLNNLKN